MYVCECCTVLARARLSAITCVINSKMQRPLASSSTMGSRDRDGVQEVMIEDAIQALDVLNRGTWLQNGV